MRRHPGPRLGAVLALAVAMALPPAAPEASAQQDAEQQDAEQDAEQQDAEQDAEQQDAEQAPAQQDAASPAAAVQAPRTREAHGLTWHSWPETEGIGALLRERLPDLLPLPGLPPDVLDDGRPVHVYLAPDAATFDRLTGGLIPEWGAGVAFPEAGVIVLPAYESRRGATHGLQRVLRHELAHVALHRYLAPTRAPRWFDEGYARWVAGEWNAQAGWKLRLAFALDRAPPLDSLSLRWPVGATDAEVAYLLSASAVGYLVEGAGERGLRIFLERWRDTGSLDAAMREVYGLTLGQFEHAWAREVRSRYGWGVFFTHSLVFWAIAALLLLPLFFLRRRRDRVRMARLGSEEPPDRPAYWLGEEDSPRPGDDGFEQGVGGETPQPGGGPHPTRGTGLR